MEKGSAMPPEEIQRRRRERAARWDSHDLRGYPALSIEEETEETLNAEPSQKEDKRKKSSDGE